MHAEDWRFNLLFAVLLTFHYWWVTLPAGLFLGWCMWRGFRKASAARRDKELSEVDCCHTAAAVERVRAQHIIRLVDKIAGERMDEPYWAGFSQACEEIAHRINDGECHPWEPAVGDPRPPAAPDTGKEGL